MSQREPKSKKAITLPASTPKLSKDALAKASALYANYMLSAGVGAPSATPALE